MCAKKKNPPLPFPSVFLLRSGLRPQFLGRALAALRSIGMANRHENKHSAQKPCLWLCKFQSAGIANTGTKLQGIRVKTTESWISHDLFQHYILTRQWRIFFHVWPWIFSTKTNFNWFFFNQAVVWRKDRNKLYCVTEVHVEQLRLQYLMMLITTWYQDKASFIF